MGIFQHEITTEPSRPIIANRQVIKSVPRLYPCTQLLTSLPVLHPTHPLPLIQASASLPDRHRAFEFAAVPGLDCSLILGLK